MEIFERYIESVIENLINNGEKNFVIYPFGKWGTKTKWLLNQKFGVQELGVVDQFLCEKMDIVQDLKWLGQMQGDYVVLIASNRKDIYKEIRDELKKYADMDKMVEILPEPCRAEQGEFSIENAVNKVERLGLREKEFIYHPQETHSQFYLPMCIEEYIQNQIFISDNYYERIELDYLFRVFDGGKLKNKVANGIVLDIGANIGNHTLYFANEVGAKKIYAFEPFRANYDILRKNIQINQLENRVCTFDCGLGNKVGWYKCGTVEKSNMGGIYIEGNEFGNMYVDRLDNYQYDDDVVFMKVDVEDMEVQVLLGGMETIQKHHPYIYIESFDFINNVKEILFAENYKVLELGNGNYLFY